jgi:hypothetical protein
MKWGSPWYGSKYAKIVKKLKSFRAVLWIFWKESSRNDSESGRLPGPGWSLFGHGTETRDLGWSIAS